MRLFSIISETFQCHWLAHFVEPKTHNPMIVCSTPTLNDFPPPFFFVFFYHPLQQSCYEEIQGNPITHFPMAIKEMCKVKWIPLNEKHMNLL